MSTLYCYNLNIILRFNDAFLEKFIQYFMNLFVFSLQKLD